jgi:hypothetical protein
MILLDDDRTRTIGAILVLAIAGFILVVVVSAFLAFLSTAYLLKSAIATCCTCMSRCYTACRRCGGSRMPAEETVVFFAKI